MGESIELRINDLPRKDQEKIAHLFSYCVQRDNLGFVLFGETKPACVCTIPLICDYSILSSTVTTTPLKYQKKVRQGWYIWNFYKHRFNHPNLIICEEYQRTKQTIFLNLFFIDKAKLLHLIYDYQEDFEQVLGENFSAEKFIAKLEKKKKLRPLIMHDEKLLGLILGFGKQASTDFRDGKFENQDLFTSLVGYKPKQCSIVPVSFRGDPNAEESKVLVEAYTQELLYIDEIFKSECFLLSVLEKFCMQN